MPLTWPRKPDRNDPEFRRLGDRVNFAFHVAVFCSGNSFLWFLYNLLRISDPRTVQVSVVWAIALVLHGIYVFGLARYPGLDRDGKPIQPPMQSDSPGN